MKKRILSVLMVLGMLLSISPVYCMAEEIENESKSEQESENDAKSGSYSAIIMQGNTYSASDCVDFENELASSNNGYNSFTRYGWRPNNDTPLPLRVTLSQFQTCNLYHVAYYSGHGGRYWDGESYPVLNASSSNSYGTSRSFNVATALGVAGNNWMTTCTIDANDNLHTMVLASCFQLDSSIVKYYARIMKASGVRVIAGYHDIAPSDGDDVIATEFVENAGNGYSVIDAWKMCNSNTNWAVLYRNVSNTQEYHLPGFPATNWINIDSDDQVYRYASFFEGPRQVVTSSNNSYSFDMLEQLPATITMIDSRSSISTGYNNRDPVWGSTYVADDDSSIVRTLTTLLGENVSAKPCAQYRVSREKVDEQIGIVPESEVVVERTYKYFDTYNGVKIADSFISASIDSEGINNIMLQRKTISSSGTNSVASNANRVIGDYISEFDALKLLLLDHSCIADSELICVSLAYVPDGSGNHVLCYEFVFSSGFHYVNVSTGEIVHF